MPSQLRDTDGMRLGVAVACVQGLGGQLEGLIFEEGLSLSVRNVPPHRQDKPKQSRSHDVANRALQKEIDDPTRKTQCGGAKQPSDAYLLEKRRNQRYPGNECPAKYRQP